MPGREGLPAAANDASTCLVVACVSAATLDQRQLRSAAGGKRLLDAVAPRYITAMKLEIELSPAQEEKLRQEAQRLNIKPEELARAALTDLLSERDEDFKTAAHHVLQKYAELYKRLA